MSGLKSYMVRQAAEMSGANDEAIDAMKEMDAVILKASKLLKIALTKYEIKILLESLDGDLLAQALKDPKEEPEKLKPSAQCKDTVSVRVKSGNNHRFKKIICTEPLRHNGHHRCKGWEWDERCAWAQNEDGTFK